MTTWHIGCAGFPRPRDRYLQKLNYVEYKLKAPLPAPKTLVAQRLKLSGMRWSPHGAQSILTMRGWDQSERFDEAWALLAATYQCEIHVLANVVDITPKPERKARGRASR